MGNLKKCIVIPDSFKGTLSSIEVCNIMKNSILNHFPDCGVTAIPIADGGEGTADCFLYALDCEKVSVQATGPYNEPLSAYYAKYENTAILEVASVAGLTQVENKQNPCKTTTYGLGTLIAAAVRSGCRQIIIGLGGSCTNDGGIGMAAALGTIFYDKDGREFLPSADQMSLISHIDTSPAARLLEGCTITAMCDINNPMHGPDGAAYIYGPQKGADQDMIELLDYNLVCLDQVIQKSLRINAADIPGAGAAGGLGAGIAAFLGGTLKSGIETILEFIHFDDMLKDTDMIFTGEGQFDSQSLCGKVVIGIAEHAKTKGIPVTVIAGSVEDDIEKAYDMGVTSVFSINRKAVDFNISRFYSSKSLAHTMDAVMRLIKSV